jgi:FAD/FMN-containing dehydrogenase
MTDLIDPRSFRGTFLTDDDARAAYSEGAGPYRIVPAAVAIPADTRDVQTLVRHARDANWTLVPRGAGSGIPGHNVGPGVIVDLRRLNRSPIIGPDRTATAGAAVPWGALDGEAAKHGLRLTPNPSSGRFCTLGGMVATNAAGARSLRAGSVRRWVRAVEMVTGEGEVVRLARGTGLSRASAVERRVAAELDPAIRRAANVIARSFPKVRKSTCGYALDHYLSSADLLDLVIGSEGTLGIVTEIELELESRPGAAAGLLVALDDLGTLGPAVEAIRQVRPSAIELLDRTFLEIAGEPARFGGRWPESVLLVEVEADRPDEAAGRVSEAVREVAPFAARCETALDPAELDRLWAVRHAASPVLARLPDHRRSLQVAEDGCVPVSALGQYVLGVRDAAREAECQVVAFGHAGDGHLHVNTLMDVTHPEFRHRVVQFRRRAQALAIHLGGVPSGEHGVGRLRTDTLPLVYPAEIIDLFGQVKLAFDPDRVLNRGIIHAPTYQPLGDLKVGLGAAPIPPAIAAALREVERQGRWETPPLELLPDRNPQ